jgi:hypothetical protein
MFMVTSSQQETVAFDGRPQRYRESAGKLQAALKHLSEMTQSQQDPVQPLSFLLTLGDIVDGYGDDDSYGAAAKTGKDLKQIVGLISAGLQDAPARHVLGNHCLAAPRTELLEVSSSSDLVYTLQDFLSSPQCICLDAAPSPCAVPSCAATLPFVLSAAEERELAMFSCSCSRLHILEVLEI